MLPCLIFEDEHLLVVSKPAGLNTHSPSPYTGEGLFDWLRHREPRWANLAIIHRLDKETSGVLVFSKTALANRSLTEQFTRRTVHKKYVLLTDRPVPSKPLVARSSLVRAGEKYISRPLHVGGDLAETRFRLLAKPGEAATGLGLGSSTFDSEPALPNPNRFMVIEAKPTTGRTHQIRVHAAEHGFPILGDQLYGGTPADRVYLHAAEIAFLHPASGQTVTFSAPADFEASQPLALRRALIDLASTSAFRLIHGASDHHTGWYVERLGDFLLSQSDQAITVSQRQQLTTWVEAFSARGAYHKILSRRVGQAGVQEASPERVLGEAAPERFAIKENGLQFQVSFSEGYSVGLFLDQRENRRRLLTGQIAAGFSLSQSAIGKRELKILNTFAYTCGFSVCAAKAGAQTTSLDLSRKYLDWGRRNFELNELDPAEHEFILGDAFDWLGRLAKKRRLFDVVLLDPPTFSRSKPSGVFRAEKDYSKLVARALPLLKPGGILFASSNAGDWPAEKFIAALEKSVLGAGRKILQRHYVAQPPDFPISRAEPGYLKTQWLRLD